MWKFFQEDNPILKLFLLHKNVFLFVWVATQAAKTDPLQVFLKTENQLLNMLNWLKLIFII